MTLETGLISVQEVSHVVRNDLSGFESTPESNISSSSELVRDTGRLVACPRYTMILRIESKYWNRQKLLAGWNDGNQHMISPTFAVKVFGVNFSPS